MLMIAYARDLRNQNSSQSLEWNIMTTIRKMSDVIYRDIVLQQRLADAYCIPLCDYYRIRFSAIGSRRRNAGGGGSPLTT